MQPLPPSVSIRGLRPRRRVLDSRRVGGDIHVSIGRTFTGLPAIPSSQQRRHRVKGKTTGAELRDDNSVQGIGNCSSAIRTRACMHPRAQLYRRLLAGGRGGEQDSYSSADGQTARGIGITGY